MNAIKYILKLTIYGILLCILTIVACAIYLLVDIKLLNQANKFRVFGDFYIENIDKSPIRKVFFGNITIADADNNSRWIISSPYLYGTFNKGREPLYIIYNCNEAHIEYFDSKIEFSKRLSLLHINNLDLDYGEGILNLKGERKYFERCD